LPSYPARGRQDPQKEFRGRVESTTSRSTQGVSQGCIGHWVDPGQTRRSAPVGDELADRLGSVLEAVYLVLNEGYTATTGEQWARAELCQEAMRLGRMLAALAPASPRRMPWWR
jgi:hypothetical protein